VAKLSRTALPALLLSACGGSQYPSLDEPLPPPETRAVAPISSAAPLPGTAIAITSLQRADVERVVDAGLGRFLTHVTLEPRLSAGKFTGWSIAALEPPALWQGIDLRPGDIVTRVNGMPIEREMEAFDAFQAVRRAPTLEVTYLRQNQPRTLRFTIVGAPSRTLPQAPAASTARPGPG
jgi:S1-C subfamily serine protease